MGSTGHEDRPAGENCNKHSVAKLGVRQGDWVWRKRSRDEDLQPLYLVPWQEQPVR